MAGFLCYCYFKFPANSVMELEEDTSYYFLSDLIKAFTEVLELAVLKVLDVEPNASLKTLIFEDFFLNLFLNSKKKISSSKYIL